MARPTLPKDANGIAIQTVPGMKPKKATYNGTISSSTQITLQTTTTLVEISAISKPVLLKWGSGAAAASAATDGFHEIIQAGVSKLFQVPTDPVTLKPYTDINLIEQAATAIVTVIEK
jgi:hypothetical protein